MASRRNFIKSLGAVGGLLSFSAVSGTPLYPGFPDLHAHSSFYHSAPAEVIATDEDYWKTIQRAFAFSPDVINLNNAGLSPQPLLVQEALERCNRVANEAPTHYIWRNVNDTRESVRTRLAELAGCTAEEVALSRSATESLETIIMGIELQKGDEVVLTKQDYPNMISAWQQRERRENIVLRFVNLDLPSEDEAAMVKKFEEQFSAQTRVVMITHLVNWSGQVLPVKSISRAARNYRSDMHIIVDGAQSFAQLDFKVTDFDCDYFGASLHKWLCAPFGTGMMYIKKERIKNLWPFFAAADPQSTDIRKFEALGTRAFPTEMAIGHAIAFHNAIGTRAKQLRLHYLKNYWVEKAMNIKGFSVQTSLKPEFSGAIATFSMKDKTPQEVQNQLMKQARIHSVAIERENVKGVRISPHIYTSLDDLNKLISVIS